MGIKMSTLQPENTAGIPGPQSPYSAVPPPQSQQLNQPPFAAQTAPPRFNVTHAQPMTSQTNPLTKYFRQPSIYFELPSKGRYWPAGALELPENGEIGVYPMTSKDEVILRTPDALINGQGMVDVIQSCMPNVKNAWKMPATDVDAALIAIRIASYGHAMDVETKCPHCSEIHTYSSDLRVLLDHIKSPNWEQVFTFDHLIIKFMPQAYFDVNKNNKVQFEIQKLAEAIDALDDPDAKANEAMNQMERLLKINLETLAEATEYIGSAENPTERVYDKNYILEFYQNVNGKLVESIQTKFAELSSVGAAKPQKINCASCTKEHDLAVVFDYAAFFGIGS
jgi:hypothetical protein